MNSEKRKFKCTSCGESRPCYVETNQLIDPYFDELDHLKCILDASSSTFEWKEISQFGGIPSNVSGF